MLPASPNYTLGENKQIPLPAKLKACRRTPALCTFIKQDWMWKQGGEGKTRESKVWAEKGWDGGARRHQACFARNSLIEPKPPLRPKIVTSFFFCKIHGSCSGKGSPLGEIPREHPHAAAASIPKQPCYKGPEAQESQNLHPQMMITRLCPKLPSLRARRQRPVTPRASPKIPKEKEKRRNYVANPRYTLLCSSLLCYFARFLQGYV